MDDDQKQIAKAILGGVREGVAENLAVLQRQSREARAKAAEIDAAAIVTQEHIATLDKMAAELGL